MKPIVRIALAINIYAILTTAAICQTTPQPSLFELSGQHLAGTPFHLPAYMTLQEQMRLQEHLPTHQKIRIEWDSLPGMPHDRLLTEDEVKGTALSAAFAVLSRNHAVPGAPGKLNFSLGPDTLVFIAATRAGEIRSLNVMPDFRIQDAEGHRFVTAKIAFDINLADDPQIAQIAFFKPELHEDHFELKRLGNLTLSSSGGH